MFLRSRGTETWVGTVTQQGAAEFSVSPDLSGVSYLKAAGRIWQPEEQWACAEMKGGVTHKTRLRVLWNPILIIFIKK